MGINDEKKTESAATECLIYPSFYVKSDIMMRSSTTINFIV